jgi:hypothetical protein
MKELKESQQVDIMLIRNENDVAKCYQSPNQGFTYESLLQEIISKLDLSALELSPISQAITKGMEDYILNRNILKIKTHAKAILYKAITEGVIINRIDKKLYLP